jgi:hypothetical protein
MRGGGGSSEWRQKGTELASYTADIRGTTYRPLDQINASNFNKLEVAWRFKTDNLGPFPEYKLEGTPLMTQRRATGEAMGSPQFQDTPKTATLVNYSTIEPRASAI